MTDERLKELEHILAGYPKSLMGPDAIEELITAVKTQKKTLIHLENQIIKLDKEIAGLRIDAGYTTLD